MITLQSRRLRLCTLASAIVFLSIASAIAQREPNRTNQSARDVIVLITVHTHNDRSRRLADGLKPEDFSVREDERPQPIISVKRAADAPPIVAVLIQDDLVSRVSNEIRGIRELIRHLPEGSRVMTGYIGVGSLRITQDFTTDRERAAASLRILVSSTSASSFSPYEQVLEALRRFDSQPSGRHMVLLISDGLDVSRGFRSASPMLSMDLDRAINESQRRGVAVFAFYAPSVGPTSRSHLAVNFGQGCLNRIADETGGEAFFSGGDFVTFDAYVKELDELLGRQWLITYRSETLQPGFHKIEVKTEYDLELLHPSGYRLREKDVPRP